MSFICTVWCCDGILPPGVGMTTPSQTLGPKKGAETWVSFRERRGEAKDWRAGVGLAGRYRS